ncbi:hypothetical protein V3C99_009569 [Haemonchus contortus]
MGNESSARTNGVIFAFEKLCFAFWIITVPFYILLMYALVRAQRKRNSSLTSSFYKLCITAGFIDIVNLLNNYFGAVFPKWGWFTSVYLFLGKPYVYTYLVIAWGSGINQAISVSMLAANRLSAILVPQYYHKIWDKQRLNLAMVIQIVPGYIIPALLFLRNKVHIRETTTGGLVPAFQGKDTTETYFTIAGLFLAVNCLFLVLAYCYLFFMLRIRHHAQLEMNPGSWARGRAKELSRREFRLFLMSSTIVAVQLILLLFISSRLFKWFPFTIEIFYNIWNVINDFYSGISAYLLWIFSDSLRHFVYMLLGFTRHPISSITPVVITLTRTRTKY